MTSPDTGWNDTLSENLERVCGSEMRDRIMEGADTLDEDSEPGQATAWTIDALGRMRDLLTAEQIYEVMTGCACRYPTGKLMRAHAAYAKRGSVEEAMAELRLQLEQSLREGMLFEPVIVDWILEHGWGVAGRLDGSSILVTKIPKSGNLRQYMTEGDPERQRELYCHCPRVREAVPAGIHVPREYCLCGAGFYRHIWETILGREVGVDVLETVCSGGSRCSFRINLPEGS
jgi:hypothetical protein